jgi:hypothetical protein
MNMALDPEDAVLVAKLIDDEVNRRIGEIATGLEGVLANQAAAIDGLANLVMGRAFGADLPETVARFWHDAIAHEAGRLGIVQAAEDAPRPRRRKGGDDAVEA